VIVAEAVVMPDTVIAEITGAGRGVFKVKLLEAPVVPAEFAEVTS
jgi:hypothetical protein